MPEAPDQRCHLVQMEVEVRWAGRLRCEAHRGGRELEALNSQLKRRSAELNLENRALKDLISRKL